MEVDITFRFLELRSGVSKDKGTKYTVLKGLLNQSNTFQLFVEDATPFEGMKPLSEVTAIFEPSVYQERLGLRFVRLVK